MDNHLKSAVGLDDLIERHVSSRRRPTRGDRRLWLASDPQVTRRLPEVLDVVIGASSVLIQRGWTIR
jgi:hypothetical protein